MHKQKGRIIGTACPSRWLDSRSAFPLPLALRSRFHSAELVSDLLAIRNGIAVVLGIIGTMS